MISHFLQESEQDNIIQAFLTLENFKSLGLKRSFIQTTKTLKNKEFLKIKP